MPATSRADDTHYQAYPIGGRAVGFGGAYVALSNDPSGLFYNPAGIVDAEDLSLQLSTNLYGLELNVAEGGLSGVAKQIFAIEEVFSRINIIPSSAGIVKKIGPSAAFGLGTFLPSTRSITQQSIQPTGTDASIVYRRDLLDRNIQGTAGFGLRVDPVFSFGLSGSFVYRSLTDSEGSAIADQTEAADRFRTLESSVDVFAGGLAFTLGVKARLDKEWQLGASVTTPTIQVLDDARVRWIQSSGDAQTGGATFAVNELTNVDASFATGTTLRLGICQTSPRGYTFSSDLSLHAPIRYRLLDVPESVSDQLTLITDIERQLVANANAGIEVWLDDGLTGSLGFYTNLSSAPSIPGPVGGRFDSDRLPDIDLLGGSIVVAFLGEHTATRIGLLLSYGQGEDVIARPASFDPIDAGDAFEKIEITQLTAFFFVSSTFKY